MREGWLIDADDHWIWRFHRDESAWIRDPKVFLDRGRQMPEGPPLLKERRYLRKDAAEQLWRSLQTKRVETVEETRLGRFCRGLSRSAIRKHKCLLGGVRPVASHESDEPRRSNTPGSFLGKRSRHPRQSLLIGEGGGRLATSRPAALSVSEGAIGIPLLFLCLRDTNG